MNGRAPRASDSAGVSGRAQASRNDVILIVFLFVSITALHLFTDTSAETMAMHLLYRKLYYVPIIYAGFMFGWRGGLIIATAAALVFGPHAQISMGGLIGPGVDNLYEIVMFLAVGFLFGWLRDLEEKKASDHRAVSRELASAYHTLEERAIQLVTIQHYTQAILQSITAGVITVGPDGSVATVNTAAERVLGMQEADMVPRRLGILFADDGGLEVVLQRVLRGVTQRRVDEMTLQTRSGKTLHARVSIARMRGDSGRVLGAVVSIEDVSEVKALTDQLIRADRLAAMGELTAGVAHEVRNPLGIIKASVQLVEESGGDPARTAEVMRVIRQEIDRLDRVIKALLDFGRPSAPTLRDTDVHSVLDDVVLFTSRFAGQASVQIETEYDREGLMVYADADQLKQVLVNLVSNA
ncbi:MAG: histidine kinase dimerization/phospho-acceptor domain-containing protein, partial [Coriobacteriia bacterium]|nr:histidine kinase dimerization/phospho-acceptor domain-containing protein [Coriobacteriia bacterium]